MKRNFLVTTGLIDTWEFYENNFVLGKWCEFYETDDYDEEKHKNIIPKKINIIKNRHHWNDNEKRNRDYKYLIEIKEYLLEIISEKLSTIHNVNESKKYWRIVLYSWLKEYTEVIFDRWEHIRIFFEKNKTKKFYSNFISLNDLDYLSKNHEYFTKIAQNHEWNHLIFLRLLHFLNIQNLSLIEKKIVVNNLKEKKFFVTQNPSLRIRALKLIDNIISKFAFKFNKVILESFYFPTKEYLKICLRCKLIPSKYSNFFNFDIKEKSLSKDNKRIEFKNLISKVDNQDKFIQFLLLNLYKDIPKSYLENFDRIKNFFLPFAQKKKIIFSMTSLYRNDNFKIYLAEAKKVGSKYMHATHGGGLTYEKSYNSDLLERVSDKIIRWDSDSKVQKNLFINLSPTLPIIKFKKSKNGNYCSIVFIEQQKYTAKFPISPLLDQAADFFNEITQFVKELNPEIKSKVKFRLKGITGLNCEKKFSDMFGAEYIDKVSTKNSFEKTILNSKLIISTYAHTAFSEAMYSNIPTILIINTNYLQLSKSALNIFDVLKKNKIAFDDFNEAKIHINKCWKELDSWWQCENVQSARKMFLANYFNVKPNWFKEWSDYIYFSSIS